MGIQDHIFDTEQGFQAFKQLSVNYLVKVWKGGGFKEYYSYSTLSTAVQTATLATECGFKVLLVVESIFQYTPLPNQTPFIDVPNIGTLPR